MASKELDQEKLIAIIEVLADEVILQNKGLNTHIKQLAFKSLLAVGYDMEDLHGVVSGNLFIGDNVDFTNETKLIAEYNENKRN